MLKIPGFLSGERFVRVGDGPYGFLAIHELETENVAQSLAEIGKRAGTDLMPITDTIDGANAQMVVWQRYRAEL